MLTPSLRLDRKGISLTEILIGIMVLGIGVLSLATLFPLGLLRMKRAVNQVRGTVAAQNAWNEVRVRNILSPPFGPLADYFARYPDVWPPAPFVDLPGPVVPSCGLGLPVIIDPLWMVQNSPAADAAAFGIADLNGDNARDFAGGDGIMRARGGSASYPLALAFEIFSSPDDLTYGEVERRMTPLQDAPGGGGPPYLKPSYGVPFTPGSLFRESRYSWLVVARKVSAQQGVGPGPDGQPGVAGVDDNWPGVDDDGDGTVDDADEVDDACELGWPMSDDTLANNGPDSIPGTADDPARDMATGTPVPAPVGPFHVTIVAFYKRDFSAREAVYANPTATPANIFTAGKDIAVLLKRTDVPFPDIPIQSYVMDTTFDSTGTVRNGFVYRVNGKSFDNAGNLVLTLDQKARTDGLVLTVLKGAVGVFEKQVP